MFFNTEYTTRNTYLGSQLMAYVCKYFLHHYSPLAGLFFSKETSVCITFHRRERIFGEHINEHVSAKHLAAAQQVLSQVLPLLNYPTSRG